MSDIISLSIASIAQLLNGTLSRESTALISSVSPIDQSDKGCVTFLSNPKYETKLYDSKASLILVKTGFIPSQKKEIEGILLYVPDPYIAFGTLQELFFRKQALLKTGRQDPIHIGNNTVIGENDFIGAFAYIGKDVMIGQHVKIHPQVHIGDGCQIGDYTILYPGVKLYDNTKIGHHCTVQSGSVIGSHGFGFAPKPDGSFLSIPQTGNVILGNHVDIGANTTIDCATLGSTFIEDGVKIDNLVQIAHNVSIGRDTVIAAQTGISGSTSVGNNVMIGGQVGTVGHIHIASETKVGARSGVTKSTKSHQVLFGVPAIDKNQYIKSYAIYKKLPEVMKRIQELEQKLLTLNPSSIPK